MPEWVLHSANSSCPPVVRMAGPWGQPPEARDALAAAASMLGRRHRRLLEFNFKSSLACQDDVRWCSTGIVRENWRECEGKMTAD